MKGKQRVQTKKSGKGNKLQKDDLLDRLNAFFDKNSVLFFWITLGLSLLISLLLFDAKVSIGGDDSEYIIGAKKFIEGTAFPTWHGSFYPIFLSLFTLVFGLNVTLFKFLSLPLMLGHHFFMYKAVKGRVPGFVLVILLLVMALNGQILYFSSSTYSEAMFFFLQALSFYIFLQLDDKIQNSESLAETWKNWLAFGFIMFLLFLTRNIGLGLIIAAVLYFLIRGNWKSSLYSILSFLVFQLPFIVYKKLVWGFWGTGAESQFKTMFYKNFYNRALGTEDFMGFIVRFWDNSLLYLSKHLYIILGLKPIGSTETSALLTLLTYLVFIAIFVAIIYKHKQFLFTGLYLGVMIGATFISQQKHWDQYRLILIYVPLIILFVSLGIHYIFKTKRLRGFQFIPLIFFFILPFLMLNDTSSLVKANIPVLKKNMQGESLYGFTPDWVNYIKMCEYAARNVPAEDGIACRKPNIASIYSEGRHFFGIYRLKSKDADTLLDYLKRNNIRYVVMGSLRINPKMKTDRTINTIRNYLYFIQLKYPQLFRQAHQIGSDEGAVLVEILWENEGITNPNYVSPEKADQKQ